MCKSEIFAETINLVAQETEIPASRILSSDKDTETVDARYLLVQLLVERGMYPSQIAPKIHKTNALVNTANQNALSLRDGATANTNAILAKLDAMQNQALQDKIAALTAEKATLTAEISQRNQNATILNSVGQ